MDPGRNLMAPTRGFAYAVSIALLLVLTALPVIFLGMAFADSALVQAGFTLLAVGTAGVVVLLVLLGGRSPAES
jgi:ABC-type microcin C transport system permease subunit YejB